MNGNASLIRRLGLGAALATLAVSATASAAAPAAQLQALVSANRIDFPTVDPLYSETLKRDGKLDEVLAQLQAISKEQSRSKHQRSNALLVASFLQWKLGLRPAAQASVEEALKIDKNADLALQEARLLEAAGELAQAQRWYDQAFELTADPKRKEDIRLRMTFVAVGQQNVDALVRLAQKRDRDFRNRAAVALAVLNHYDEAAGLYQIYGDEADQFRQHLRLAQWALEAGDTPTAQSEAWKAVQTASLDRDQRYALSVLVDAHEADKSLDKLLKEFEKKGKLSADEQDIRIDLLQRLGRNDEAIRLFNENGRTDITPASRRQLLRMYSEAGHPEQMVAEYRKLIASDPEQPAWPEGLSQHFMEQGDRDAALQVWKDFITRTNHTGSLLAGAAAMARFGFDDLAMQAADKCVTVDPQTASEALLFRFELDMRRGRSAAAEEVLRTMDRTLPLDSVDRVDLADAYERIKKPMESLKVLDALDKNRAGGLGTDERMRMAWLYDSTGQRDKALGVWKTLWNGQVAEAFRRLVEDRLVKLAAETGSLGDVAVELETKLADGTASKKDAGLLIRIYTDTNDSASAIEVIREYFSQLGNQTGKDGKVDVESLREQANVYRTLGRTNAYKSITTRLLDLDPENKVDYLQSLVLTQLEKHEEETPASMAQLKSWLEQLRGTGGAAAGAEFEAGILVLAGQEDQAIATYRNALAEHPEHSDNYLLLADLLKKKGREAEAIAALQYLIETADHDDAFMVGVDGILNMKPRDKSIIEWAQRRVLERLTSRDDKLYLYELLGELAEGSGNTEMYFSALENSLAYANSRRSNVLRELIAASGEKDPMNAMMGVGSAGRPDQARNMRYSRRLVSLGEELPPEVYTDMGKSFLKMGDAESAADAFNRAVDRTGDQALVEQTGDMFRNEGFNRYAARQYERALISDADNAGLMRKLADMRNRQGESVAAEDLYVRALMDVMHGLPLEMEKVAQGTPPTFDSTMSYEYKENFVALMSGFLYALPGDESRFSALQKSFDEVMTESTKNISGASSKELAYYPRLNAFSRFMREAALRSGRVEMADALDSRLLRYFGNDATLVSELVSQRKQWGLPGSAVKLAAQAQGAAADQVDASSVQASAGLESVLPSRAAATQALNRKEYDRAIGLALYNKDPQTALAVYRDWAKESLTSARKPTMEQMMMGEGGRGVMEIMSDARDRLDGQSFASLSRYVIDLAHGRPEYLRKLLAGSGYSFYFFGGDEEPKSLLLDMEKAAGRSAMTESELSGLVTESGQQDPSRGGAMGVDMAYVRVRLPADDLVDLVVMNIGGDAESSMKLSIALPAFSAALAKPLTPQQSARILDGFKKGIQKQMNAAGFSIMSIVSQLQQGQTFAEAHPANAALIEDIDSFLATSYPKVFTPGSLKIDAMLAAKKEREALPLIVDTALAAYTTGGRGGMMAMMMGPMGGGRGNEDAMAQNAVTQYLQRYMPKLSAEGQAGLKELVQAKEKELGFTPAVYALLMAVENTDPASDPQRQLRWLEDMAVKYPDKEQILVSLSRAYQNAGYVDLQMKTLEKLVTLVPRKQDYRKELFQAWRRLGSPVDAVAVANKRLADMTQQNPNSMRGAMRAMNGRGQLGPSATKSVEQIVALDKGGSEDQARIALRGLLRQLPPASDGMSGMRMMMMMGGNQGERMLQYPELYALDWRVPEPPKEEKDDDEDDDQSMEEMFFSGVQMASSAPTIEMMTSDEPRVDPWSRDGKLLDKVAEHEFSIDELEAQIRTLRAQDIDSQYLLYSVLADAYQKNGKLESELTTLTAKVQAGQAGGKDRVLWLETLLRAPQEQVVPLLPLVEKAVGAAGGADGYEQVLLARVFARGGDEARAAEIYSSAVLSKMSDSGAGARYYFGGGANTSLTTATALYVDAARYMTPAGLERFAATLLKVIEPTNEYVAASGLYEQFVMWMLERTPDSKVVQDRFRALTSAPQVEKWQPTTLIQAAVLLARHGRQDDALKMMAQELRPQPKGDPSMQAMMRRRGDNPGAQQVQRYGSGLGLDQQGGGASGMAFAGGAMMVMMASSGGRGGTANSLVFKPLFPATADAWPGAGEWTQRAATQLAQWIGQGTADRDRGMEVLALATVRLHQQGAKDAAIASAVALGKLLAPYEAAQQKMATLVVATQEHVEAPIDTTMLRSLIEHRRLDVRVLGAAIRRVAATDGAAQAVTLGQLATAYTQEPNLIQTLKSLAPQAGKPELVQTYVDLEQKSSVARQAIAAGRDLAASAEAPEALADESAGAGPSVGSTMDLKFTAVDGRAVDLAALKGKVVLVDFWATWCGPCRAELPNLKKVYQTYHDKGFEVIGISLDRAADEQKLKDFVAENNMPWPHHFDGKYWKNEFAVKNGVNAIPAAWLFDQEGKLVTKNARGKKLEDEVDRLLATPTAAAK